VLVPVVSPGFGQAAELRAGVHNALDDREQVKGAARQAVDARHRHHVAGGEAVEQFEKLVPVGPRARHFLAVNLPASGGAKLVELGVEGLPVGADPGVADEAFFEVSFGHILRQT
jgi:hypothetical protein